MFWDDFSQDIEFSLTNGKIHITANLGTDFKGNEAQHGSFYTLNFPFHKR